MSSTTVTPGSRPRSAFIQTFDSLVSSGSLAQISGNAFKTLTALGLAASPLGTGSRQSQALFQNLVAAGAVSPRDRGRLFACLRHRELLRRTGLSKNTLSRCTAELEVLQMVEKRRVHQAGGTAYNLFFLLPGAHLDKYNTLHPRPAPDHPASPPVCAQPPSAGGSEPQDAQSPSKGHPELHHSQPPIAGGPEPHRAQPQPTGGPEPQDTQSPSKGRPDPQDARPPSARRPGPPAQSDHNTDPAAAPQPATVPPVPTAGPVPSGPLPRTGILPTVGTNLRSIPTTTPPPTCSAAQNLGGNRPPPSAGASPALVHARALYQAEIGRVTPLVDGELRRLAHEHPDPSSWDTAFREAVRANVRQLRYVDRILEARAAGTTRHHSPSGGKHVSRSRSSPSPHRPAQSRPPGHPYSAEKLAEAQRRAAAVEPVDLVALLGTAKA